MGDLWGLPLCDCVCTERCPEKWEMALGPVSIQSLAVKSAGSAGSAGLLDSQRIPSDRTSGSLGLQFSSRSPGSRITSTATVRVYIVLTSKTQLVAGSQVAESIASSEYAP